MSRRSSYGYGKYTARSYSSYGYRKHDGGNKKIIIVILVIVLVLAAAVGACFYFGVFDRLFQTSKTEESSAAGQETSLPESSAEKKPQESSAAEEPSQTSEEVSKAELKGSFDGNVFIYGDHGFEMFYGSTGVADQYIQTVNAMTKKLGSGVTVYNLTAPTHSLYGLSEKYRELGSDEAENIAYICTALDKSIKKVNVINALEQHKNEYIYFGTDHNWTALGAYYAYTEFCKTAGLKAVPLSSLSKGNISGFQGSLTAATKTDDNPKGNKILLAHPDTVTYYTIPGDYTCTLLENGKSEPAEVPLIATFAEGSNAYSAFIWGSNPYMHIKTKLKTGKKLCMITDSYGCAFAPFTVTNYDEIFIVDPRYYEGNIVDYIQKNKFTDVLLINSVMTANTQIRTNELKSIL